MLETYFVKPSTVDRVRASWLGPEVERYADWLANQGYAARCILSRVPLLVAFGEFARRRGARDLGELPTHLDHFVEERISGYRRVRDSAEPAERLSKEIWSPVEQFLEYVLPGFTGRGRPHRRIPFVDTLPNFFESLVSERGLRQQSVRHYQHHLSRFETYLDRVEIQDLRELSPAVLSAFVAERSAAGLAKSSVRNCCGVLRVFLRYAHREGAAGADLSETIEWPQVYRLSHIPRSISWDDVGKVLTSVDRRTPCGRRDYAILLLLVTYGLRSREVAAMTLDHIDWRRERLAVPERKAAHSTAFPLSKAVGEAILDYLQHGRPKTSDRHVFFRSAAPLTPLGSAAISACARKYLLRAGVQVPRPGSHSLRHTLVQRLVDANFGLKEIGDFVGHRSPASTQIYGKVAIKALRQVALGDGEAALDE
jgi:site-specific recombinase XerD